MKLCNLLFYGLALISLIFIISLLSFYFHAAYVLGKFPSYGQPDPKELSFYVYYAPIIHLTLNTWLLSFIPWFIYTTVYVIAKRKQISWQPLIISALCHIGAIAIFLSGISEWFAD